jgi:hypothetical protein
MTPRRIEVIVYTLGVSILGLAYYQLKAAMSGWVFVTVALAYLVVVRLVGFLIARRLGKTADDNAKGDA